MRRIRKAARGQLSLIPPMRRPKVSIPKLQLELPFVEWKKNDDEGGTPPAPCVAGVMDARFVRLGAKTGRPPHVLAALWSAQGLPDPEAS